MNNRNNNNNNGNNTDNNSNSNNKNINNSKNNYNNSNNNDNSNNNNKNINTVTFFKQVEGGQPQCATEVVEKIYLNPDVFQFSFSSGCLNRGRPDAMLCGGSLTYQFGCLRVRMFKNRHRSSNDDNPLPLIINLPTPLIINTPQIWYTIIYWEYLLLGSWGGLLLGGGDYLIRAGKVERLFFFGFLGPCFHAQPKCPGVPVHLHGATV